MEILDNLLKNHIATECQSLDLNQRRLAQESDF